MKKYERFVYTSIISFLVIIPPLAALSQTSSPPAAAASPSPSGQSNQDCLSQSHIDMRNAPWLTPPMHGPNNDPNNPIKYDEYSVTISEMPPGVTPEQLLDRMLVETPNNVVKNPDFDKTTFFTRTTSGTPAIGDIYHIDFPGPDNGSVVLVERTNTYFIFQTVETPFWETGAHPESGVREIGFEKNFDGSVTIYTRGVSQANLDVFGSADLTTLDLLGSYYQNKAWTGFMQGITDEINRLGGASDFSTFSKYVVRLPYDEHPANYGCVLPRVEWTNDISLPSTPQPISPSCDPSTQSCLQEPYVPQCLEYVPNPDSDVTMFKLCEDQYYPPGTPTCWMGTPEGPAKPCGN